MNTASEELTRVCIIGGDWNGRGCEGANTFWEEPYATESLETFEAFRAAVADCIRACPFVHYDNYAEQLVQVSNDSEFSRYDDGRNRGKRKGLDVLRLVEPDESVLRDWYEDLKVARDA